MSDPRDVHAACLRSKQDLEREIDRSEATPKQKAFMRQHLAHLWASVDKALGGFECRP